MLNKLAKFFLITTALAPILGAIAINQIVNGKAWYIWGAWIIAAFALIACCWGVLKYASKNAQKCSFHIKHFERSDNELLAFLVTYLLPFISPENMAFENGQWITGVYILFVIYLVMVHADALHFNPVMWIFGYHFYHVQDNNSVSHLLISQETLNKPGKEVQTVQLSQKIYLTIKK